MELILNGHLLHSYYARIQVNDSLYALAAQILATDFLNLQRNIIRQYHKEIYFSYSIDGEIDTDYLFIMEPDGWRQSRVLFDRQNSFNSILKQALIIVRPYAMSDQTRNIINHAITMLGEQKKAILSPKKLPTRNMEWKRMYDLASDIVSGAKVSHTIGKYKGEGFVVNTWRLWEWLITTGLRIGNTEYTVLPQTRIKWGTLLSNNRIDTLTIKPDIMMISKKVCGHFLVDAKYKVINKREGDNVATIDRSDLYESYAFCNGANCKNLILIYPEDESYSLIPGYARKCQIYNIQDKTIIVVKVSFGSLATIGGIIKFSSTLQSTIFAIMEDLEIGNVYFGQDK